MKKVLFSELATERLQLRRLRTSDVPQVAFLRSDAQVNRYVKRAKADTPQKALAFIARIHQEMSDDSIYYWAITQKGNDTMIGSICLWKVSKDRRSAEVGYDLHPEFEGKGIMSESMRLVLEFGFNALGLEAIAAYTHRKNVRSVKLLKRCGFELVRGQRDQQNADNIVYSMQRVVHGRGPTTSNENCQ